MARLKDEYGFITGDDGFEYWFHRTACRAGVFDRLQEKHSRVVFKGIQTAKGRRALDVMAA